MAIDDAGTIDALGIEPETGYAMMIISDHLSWLNLVAHLNALQQKVGAYLRFIQSGQLDAALPEGIGRKRKIGIIQQFEPTEIAHQLLQGVSQHLAAFDVEFGYGPLPEGYDTQG
ncbi:MAG: DUF6572 domain-containing protein [Hyphomonadaceae bacterium]